MQGSKKQRQKERDRLKRSQASYRFVWDVYGINSSVSSCSMPAVTVSSTGTWRDGKPESEHHLVKQAPGWQLRRYNLLTPLNLSFPLLCTVNVETWQQPRTANFPNRRKAPSSERHRTIAPCHAAIKVQDETLPNRSLWLASP